MAAQNTKTIQYRLRNGQSVEVTINNDGVPGEKVSISDLAIEKTIMCHLGFTEEVSKKHGERWNQPRRQTCPCGR